MDHPTIFMAEIIGLSELSSQLAEEEFTGLMNECIGFVMKKIELHGGMVSNMDGENLKAVFGVPEAFKDSPLKAMEAAIDLMERFKLFNQVNEFPHEIGFKAGLETGPVISGKVGSSQRSQYNIFGNTVTIAARICDFADAGQILAGSGLHESLKQQFNFFPLEPVPVRGLAKPLPIFELKGKKKKEIGETLSTGRMISSEMVGRQAESELLQNKVHELLKGKGAVVNIIGKAGIGKSRLIAETRQKELMKQVALFEGRAVSNGQNLSFHPIIQIIKSWAGITEKDTSDEAKNKLENNIRRIYPEAIEEIFPFIATMMGYRLDGKAKDRIEGIEGEALENLILKNLRDLLSRAASLRLVVIVIEDAHWCDMSSVVFMESLFKLVKKQRLLFVNVFRPGYKNTGERLQKFLSENLKDHHNEILVESLTKEESNELINNLLHKIDLPNEINDLIIERSGGNPFFIEEVVRSFLDEGLIEIKDDRFILTENIKYANIPETIDAVLLNRIDRLDDKTKNLLRTASVIGRNFYYKVLEEAAQTIEEVDNKLEYLKDVQLINERKQKDEVEFLFKHALTQQATYESIMEKTRKDLHLKIATSIERVFDTRINEFYGMLAHHYSKAGQQDKAEEYFIKAGEESMKSGASSEAVNFLKRALELIDHNNKHNQQKIIDLEEKLAFALNATGQFLETIKFCDRLIAYYYKPFPKSNIRRLIDLFVNIILMYRVIYFFKYNPEAKSQDIYQRLLKINLINSQSMAFVDPRSLFFLSLYSMRFIRDKQFGNYEAIYTMAYSRVTFYTGYLFNLGKKLISWGRKFVDEKFIREWVWGQSNIAEHDYFTGMKTIIENEEKIISYTIRIGNFFDATQFYFYECLILIEKGDEKQTMHYLNRIFQVAEAFDSNSSLAQYHRLNLTYNIKFRKLDNILQIAETVLVFLRRNNVIYVLIALYSYRSMAYTFRGDYAEAEKNLLEAEKIVKNLKILTLVSVYLIAKCYYDIAIFKTNSGNGKDAIKTLRTTDKLIKLARKIKKNQPEAYRLRATIFWLTNKPGKALRNFGKSIKAGLDYDCKLELSRTYFEAGKFLSDPKNKKERINGMNATECLLKAKSMFEEMNLEWDLKQYEKYMNGEDVRFLIG